MSRCKKENCIHFKVCEVKNYNYACPYFEPEKPQGDLISRSALKEAIEQIKEDYIDDNFFWIKLFNIIDNAPTISESEDK